MMGGDKGGPIVIDDDDDEEETQEQEDEEVQLQLNKQNRKRLRPNGTGEAVHNTSRPKGLDVGVLRSTTSKSLSSYRHTTKRTRTLSPDSSPTYSGSFFDNSDSDSHENYVYAFDETSERSQRAVGKGKEAEFFEYEYPSDSDKADCGSTNTNSTPLSPNFPTSPSGDSWLTTTPIKTEGEVIKTMQTTKVREESNWKDALYRYVGAVFDRAHAILEPRALRNEIKTTISHLNNINQHEYYRKCSNEIERGLQEDWMLLEPCFTRPADFDDLKDIDAIRSVVNAARETLDLLIAKHQKKLESELSSVVAKRKEIGDRILGSVFGELSPCGTSSNCYESVDHELGKELDGAPLRPRLERVAQELAVVTELNVAYDTRKRQQKGIKRFLSIHREFFKAVYDSLKLVK